MRINKQISCRGQHPLGLLVDPEDQHWLDNGYWTLSSRGYAYRCIDNLGKHEFLHTVIMQPPAGFVVDHINGIKLDNRRSNLRNVIQQHNVQNRTVLNSNNKTGYRNVQFVPRLGRWKAEVKVSRKSHHLGYFSSPEDANLAAIAFRKQNMPGYVEWS
jgi:hypothetical protein